MDNQTNLNLTLILTSLSTLLSLSCAFTWLYMHQHHHAFIRFTVSLMTVALIVDAAILIWSLSENLLYTPLPLEIFGLLAFSFLILGTNTPILSWKRA